MLDRVAAISARDTGVDSSDIDKKSSAFAASFKVQTTELIKRNFKAQWRNGSYHLTKLSSCVFFGLFIGFCTFIVLPLSHSPFSPSLSIFIFFDFLYPSSELPSDLPIRPLRRLLPTRTLPQRYPVALALPPRPRASLPPSRARHRRQLPLQIRPLPRPRTLRHLLLDSPRHLPPHRRAARRHRRVYARVLLLLLDGRFRWFSWIGRVRLAAVDLTRLFPRYIWRRTFPSSLLSSPSPLCSQLPPSLFRF
jgi:hypothetical protein